MTGYSHRLASHDNKGMVPQVMSIDITNKIISATTKGGTTPSRTAIRNGMKTSTKGAAPMVATTAILYLGGGTITECPGRVNHASMPLTESTERSSRNNGSKRLRHSANCWDPSHRRRSL